MECFKNIIFLETFADFLHQGCEKCYKTTQDKYPYVQSSMPSGFMGLTQDFAITYTPQGYRMDAR